MSDDAPVRPHMSAVSITVGIGTAACVEAVDLDGFPSLVISHPRQGIGVSLEPFGPGEGGPLTECDVLRGKELAAAAATYAAMLETAFERARGGEAMTTETTEATEPETVDADVEETETEEGDATE